MIAVAGLDMAAWDALVRAAGVPLCVLLGGSIGAVPAYKSNGLCFRSPEEIASEAVELRDEGGFQGLKLRLGRERLADDIAAIKAVREAVGSEINLMVDFNQGLHLGRHWSAVMRLMILVLPGLRSPSSMITSRATPGSPPI